MIEHHMTFTDLHAEPRLDTDFDVAIDSDDEDEYHVGNCILRDVGVGIVTYFPYDYMHLVCFGVVRNMAIGYNASFWKKWWSIDWSSNC